MGKVKLISHNSFFPFIATDLFGKTAQVGRYSAQTLTAHISKDAKRRQVIKPSKPFIVVTNLPVLSPRKTGEASGFPQKILGVYSGLCSPPTREIPQFHTLLGALKHVCTG